MFLYVGLKRGSEYYYSTLLVCKFFLFSFCLLLCDVFYFYLDGRAQLQLGEFPRSFGEIVHQPREEWAKQDSQIRKTSALSSMAPFEIRQAEAASSLLCVCPCMMACPQIYGKYI